ncbi:hypothetical protein RC74_17725 [Falsihalocynthiibacter arcticus]|uniref:Uncharacterized protein n=1 Tax=Falsihalocynthiibacter arcticus TaxID=1579316 RepID=A0A126V3F5_9RHOB|nr:hypothetical protein RC74_17725 [Falsihalocynthiibacter arcticus]
MLLCVGSLGSSRTFPAHHIQVHGITNNAEIIFIRALRRAPLLKFFECLDPCLVGIEACLNETLFGTLGDARKTLEEWQEDHN